MIDLKVDVSVAQLLDRLSKSSLNKEAIYDGSRRLTFQEIRNESNEIAGGLLQLGIKPGDRVAVCLPTWYEFITIVYAISRVGAVVVPFNTRYREAESEHILQNSGAKAVFFTKEFDNVNHLSQLQIIQTKLPSLKHLITVRFEHEGTESYDKLRKIGRSVQLPEVNVNPKEDLFAIIYTSGTTGKPKGAMITHHNIIAVGKSGSSSTRSSRQKDTTLQVSPYFHIMGIGSIVRMMLFESKAVILEKYQAERVLQLIEQEKITVRGGVPTMFILEMNHPAFKSYDLSSLRLIVMAGAPCPVEVVRKLKREIGCPVMVSYGMTETSAALTYTSLDDDEYIQAETVGKAIPGVEIKAVDDNRQEVEPGGVGELICRSVGLMKGYYQAPEKTRKVIDEEGWFYTGDLVTIDEKGYVRMVGRKRDMIIRGGYNIYPVEIEAVFYTHPSVMEVSIVGLPDSVLGEVSCAAIKLKEESNITVEEFKSFIQDKVADYKRPDHIVIVDFLPRTHSGKVKKFELKNMILNNKMVTLR